jgi:hypothetical protein
MHLTKSVWCFANAAMRTASNLAMIAGQPCRETRSVNISAWGGVVVVSQVRLFAVSPTFQSAGPP